MQTTTLSDKPIFRSSAQQPSLPVTLTGEIPAWVSGDLIRTAPAIFQEGRWRANHWFDGLGMLYRFRVEQQRVHFYQRTLESELQSRLAAGFTDRVGFATGMKRGFFQRLLEPIPHTNDNTNVNIVKMGQELVAMTETNVQNSIDQDTLKRKGPVHYQDELKDSIFMLAHPHADFDKGTILNLGFDFSFKSGIVVYEHEFASRTRRVIAKIPLRSIPYVHAFGVTPKHVIIFGGPLLLEPWRLLWSEKGFIEHFNWRPESGSTVYVIERATGAVRTHKAPSMFVFHTINAFERNNETVLDFVAYDDSSIINDLKVESLVNRLPNLTPKPVRVVMQEGRESCLVEPLAQGGFEFPNVDYRRYNGQPYRLVWGAENAGESSTLVCLDLQSNKTSRYRESGWVFGEPIFVAEPGSNEEGRGVILSVAGHLDGKRAAMGLFDARSLERLAWAEIPAPIPLGFHGSFVSSQSVR